MLAPSLILQPDPYASEPSSRSVIALPIDIDLCLHALPAISLLIDFFAFERSYGERDERILAPGMATLFALWYSNWVEYCARKNGTCKYLSFLPRSFDIADVNCSSPLPLPEQPSIYPRYHLLDCHLHRFSVFQRT